MHTPSLLMILAGFALMLGPLIVLHELGHYGAGRLFGVKADAFSVGFGRELIGRTDRRGTRWKLCLFPLGGYVMFAGDLNAASAPDPAAAQQPARERAQMLQYKPLWQRAIVIAAGPVVNLLVAVVIFAAFNMAYGRITATPVIANFSPDSVARTAGLQLGDTITAINGDAITSFEQIRDKVLPFPGETIAVQAERGGKPIRLSITIADHLDRDPLGNTSHIGLLGIAAGKPRIERLGPVDAVTTSFSQTWNIMRMTGTGLRQIVTGRRSVHDLSGPVKMAKVSGYALSLGWLPFVEFVAFVSINLAFINLLPIPGLDGGHLVFIAAEAVRRKPVSLRGQEWALRTGIALVLALMLFVTVNDLLPPRLFGG